MIRLQAPRSADRGTPPRPAVLIMAKAPRAGAVKTRLEPLLGPAGCAALAGHLIRNAAGVGAAALLLPRQPGPDGDGAGALFVAVDPPGACAEMGGLLPEGTRLLAQRGKNLGERLAAACIEVFAGGYQPVVVIGTDAPTMTPERIGAAFRELGAGRDAVFGPALDGGYYLVGIKAPAPELFALDPELWGSSSVLAASLTAARRAGLRTGLLAPLRDLDTPQDAQALLGDPVLPAAIAGALRGAQPDPSVAG